MPTFQQQISNAFLYPYYFISCEVKAMYETNILIIGINACNIAYAMCREMKVMAGR